MFNNFFFLGRNKIFLYRLNIFKAIVIFLLFSSVGISKPILSNLTGVILDSETLDPIPNVVIAIEGEDLFVTSRADGSFLIKDLSKNSYVISFSHLAYHKKQVEINIDENSPLSLKIYLTPKTINISDVIVTDKFKTISKFDEIAEYTNVLKGKKLQRDLAQTLAETLKRETGLSIRSMGPAPSRPVIRGLGQDRILISEDGNKTSDLSATSPDHAVTIEPFTSNRIELIRGPKVLLQTPTTLGGVVNVIRNEIPEEIEEHFHLSGGFYGETANNGYLGSLSTDIPLNPFAIRLEISKRNADDITSPLGELKNSYSSSLNYSAAGSYIDDFGFIGASFRGFELDYGIPGGFIGAHPNGVDIKIFRRQSNFRSGIKVDSNLLEDIQISFGNSLYRHKEFESSGRIGSEFRILNNAGSVNLNHKDISIFDNGTVGFSFEHRDFDIGGYVFTPPSKSLNIAGYFFETLRTGKFSFEFGGRYNFDNVSPDQEIPDSDIGAIFNKTFNTYSLSFSTLYEITDYVFIGSNISKSSRVPTLEELFSQGPHLAAYSYEVGNPNLTPESGIGTELFVYHKFENVIFNINLFYNDLSSYIIPRNTGEINYQTFLPIYKTYGVGAIFKGAEVQFDWKLIKNLALNINFPYTSGKFKESGSPLPQIPPFKSQIEIKYTMDNLNVGIISELADEQTRVDVFEEPTKGYFVNNLFLHYTLITGELIHNLSLSVDNIFDVTYYNHLSRIKSILPEAGRNFRVSYKMYL